MNDTELDRLLGAAARVTDADVDRWDLAGPEHEMREAIMSTPIEHTRPAPDAVAHPDADMRLVPRRDRSTRAQRRRVVAAAAVATLAVLCGTALWAHSDDPDAVTQPEAPTSSPAAQPALPPRLLIDQPGWVVETADEESRDDGGMTLTDGVRSVELSWSPIEGYEFYRNDRRSSAAEVDPATVLGQEAEIFVPGFVDDAGIGSFRALWPHGAVWVEARADVHASGEMQELLDAMVEVDTTAWYAAMPADVVTPPEVGPVIDGMLQDVPVPPAVGFDDLDQVQLVRSRYQLGVAVITRVGCGWLDAWVAATDRGDDVAAQQAVDAMASSHAWAILIEMDAEGGWPDAFWEYADAMPTNASIGPGSGFAIGDTYRQALGCDPSTPAGF